LSQRQSIRVSPPVWLGAGNRTASVYLCRLRNRSSALHGHLFSCNLTNEATCRCGEPIEDTPHFPLQCPRHNGPRAILQQNLNWIPNLNVDILLHGNLYFTLEENLLIMKAIQNFILLTNRFTHSRNELLPAAP
jgi:hypothetical protein